MRSIEIYSLTPGNTPHQSIPVREGKALALELDGIVLDGQYQLSDGRELLWITDDSPHDEGLHIYLIERGKIIDAVEAGADFAEGGEFVYKLSH
jgi:hypothetical protein